MRSSHILFRSSFILCLSNFAFMMFVCNLDAFATICGVPPEVMLCIKSRTISFSFSSTKTSIWSISFWRRLTAPVSKLMLVFKFSSVLTPALCINTQSQHCYIPALRALWDNVEVLARVVKGRGAPFVLICHTVQTPSQPGHRATNHSSLAWPGEVL